jgi:hypothetical protein
MGVVKTTLRVQIGWFASAVAAFAAIAAAPSATFFDNDQVKVVRALEKVHVKGKFHEHKVNRVMIYLQSGRQHFEYKDGRAPADFDWKAGQVVWSKPDGMHSPEVTSEQPFNIVEVEVKKPGTAASMGTLKGVPKHARVELENDQVRVLRVKLGAHEKAGKVAFAGNSVTVFLSGKRAGEAVWETAGSGELENQGDEPLEMVIVELKS